MAEFSKQWCDRNDQEGMEPDFDIETIAEPIEEGFCLNMICEGYGFIAIGKQEGKIILAFPTGEMVETPDGPAQVVDWKPYSELN
jgi:hypothetical protein